MRRVRFSVAMSLDGYIAGPNGESDWIVIDPDIDFRALMGAFDTVLLGRKTYEAVRQQGGGPVLREAILVDLGFTQVGQAPLAVPVHVK